MLAYKYSEKTNEYIGPTVVLEDPLESQKLGKVILAFPPNCTLVAPSEAGENEVAIFDTETGTWSIEKDYRGCTVYTRRGNPMVIEEIGDIPVNYSLEKPITLQELKIEMVNQAKTLYSEMLSKELTIGKIKTSVSKRVELLNLLNLFGEHKSVSFENSDEDIILVTKEEIEEVEKYLYIYETLLAKAKGALITEIKNCTNKSTIKDIEIKLDIDNKLEELMKLSTEEVDEYFTGE